MTQGNTSGGRPKRRITTLPMAFPALRPSRRRSHLRSLTARYSGMANGIMSTQSGQISPWCRVLRRFDSRRVRAARHGRRPGPAGACLDVLTGAPRMFVEGMGKLSAFDHWPATTYLTAAAS